MYSNVLLVPAGGQTYMAKQLQTNPHLQSLLGNAVPDSGSSGLATSMSAAAC